MPKFRTRRVDVNGMSPEEFERHLRETREKALHVSVGEKKKLTMKESSPAARGRFFSRKNGHS